MTTLRDIETLLATLDQALLVEAIARNADLTEQIFREHRHYRCFGEHRHYRCFGERRRDADDWNAAKRDGLIRRW
jgi:hypothetical protein